MMSEPEDHDRSEDGPPRLQTPRFIRTEYGPVVHLSSSPGRDVVPPARIGDLLITQTDNKETAINNPHSIYQKSSFYEPSMS